MVYIDQLYSKFESTFYELNIFSEDMLLALIKSIYPQYFYKQHYFVSKEGKFTEIEGLEHDVISIWGDEKLQNYGNLKDKLDYIPIDKIKYILSMSGEFVRDSSETYTMKRLFKMSDEEYQNILDYLETHCTGNDSVHFRELPTESIFENNYTLSELSIISLVCDKYSDEYERNKYIIRKKKRNVDTSKLLLDYCIGHQLCSMEELQQYMYEVSGVIRNSKILDIANSVLVRVEENLFVKEDEIDFNVDAIDAVLEEQIHDSVIGMKQFFSLSLLPSCQYTWNLFLLESFCRRFSKKYRYLTLTPNSKNAGCLIPIDSNYSFQDAIIENLSHVQISPTEDAILDYLVDNGFITKRKYGDIKDILAKISK